MAMRIAQPTHKAAKGLGPLLHNRLVRYDDESFLASADDVAHGTILFWTGEQDFYLNQKYLAALPPDLEARVLYVADHFVDEAADLYEAGEAFEDTAIEGLDQQLRYWGWSFTEVPIQRTSPDTIWQELSPSVRAEDMNWRLLKKLWQDAMRAAEHLAEVEQETFSLKR